MRSHATGKSKNSAIVPPGALLIAPDGEVLFVGGPAVNLESTFVYIRHQIWHSYK